MSNYNYGDYKELAPKDINEPHMPVAFALDISSSMCGKPVEMLNKSVNRFKEQVCEDPKAARGVDVSIIGFNDSPTVVQNWRSITKMEQVSLSAGGGTNIATALDLAVNKLRERGHLYEDVGFEVKCRI